MAVAARDLGGRYPRLFDRLARSVASYRLDAASPEDIAQDAIEQLLARCPDVESPEEEEAWARQVAKRKALNRGRRLKFSASTEPPDEPAVDDVEEAALAGLIADELAAGIRTAIAGLSLAQQRAVILALSGEPLNATQRKDLSRARTRIRDRISGLLGGAICMRARCRLALAHDGVLACLVGASSMIGITGAALVPGAAQGSSSPHHAHQARPYRPVPDPRPEAVPAVKVAGQLMRPTASSRSPAEQRPVAAAPREVISRSDSYVAQVQGPTGQHAAGVSQGEHPGENHLICVGAATVPTRCVDWPSAPVSP
jgi:DNA-directed RNA polymerase specialized sigma24 family protein